MKTTLKLIIFILFANTCFANYDDLFQIDNKFIEQQFEPLNQFENAYLNVEQASLMLNSVNQIPLNLDKVEGFQVLNLFSQNVLGVPTSMLSLMLGPIGIATSQQLDNKDMIILGLFIIGVVVVAGVTFMIISTTKSTSDSCSQSVGNSVGEACSNSCSSSSSSSSSSGTSNSDCCSGSGCGNSTGGTTNDSGCGMQALQLIGF